MDNLTIDDYYKRLLQYNNGSNIKNREIKKDRDQLEFYIKTIIENNNKNLLTDSIIRYTLTETNNKIIDVFKGFCSNIRQDTYTFSFLCGYYTKLIYDVTIRNNDRKREYSILLDPQTKELLARLNDYLDHVLKDDYYDITDKVLINRICIGILSYCHINDKKDKFDNIVTDILNNINLIIDNFRVNGFKFIDEVDEPFMEQIYNLIEHKTNKIMIK